MKNLYYAAASAAFAIAERNNYLWEQGVRDNDPAAMKKAYELAEKASGVGNRLLVAGGEKPRTNWRDN